MKNKKLWISLFIIIIAFRLLFGIFIIQPIGAIPDGATIVYFRAGLNLPFVASADGLLEESGAGVSLLGRGLMIAKISELLEDRKVMTLPYSNSLYLWSTDGKEYSN